MPDTPDTPQEPEQLIDQPTEGFALMASLVNEQLNNIEQAIEVFAQDPLEKSSGATLSKILTTHMETIRGTVETLCKESETDDNVSKLRAALRYVLGLEQRRVTFLNENLGFEDDTFKPADYDAIDDVIDDVDDMEFDPVATAIAYYKNSLDYDMDALSDRAITAYSERPSTHRKELLLTLGGHALDVAKMGMAVFGAIVVAKHSKIL